jgi:hypothetical protein
MTKREFVQRAAIRFLDPMEPDVDRAIRWAERLWQRLTERGYGAAQEKGPRDHIDWIARLSEQQRAAMRWSQINPDETTARHIIEAAAAEAKRQLPDGQSRKMAEGWLSERRWEDHTPTQHETTQSREQERRKEWQRLQAELTHLERLHAATTGEAAGQLLEQIEDLRGRITALEVESDD